jgi:proteasome-associated ATPase
MGFGDDPFGNGKKSPGLDGFFRELQEAQKKKQRRRTEDVLSGGDPYAPPEQKLEEAKQIIREQQDFIERIQEQPNLVAQVAQVHGDKVAIASPKGMIEVDNPPDMNLQGGESVRLAGDSMQIMEKAPIQPTGEVLMVKNANPKNAEDMIEVKFRSETCLIHQGQAEDVEDGDRVVTGNPPMVALKNLGKEEEGNDVDGEQIGVTWDEIGGLEEAKQVLQDSVELPFKYPGLFEAYDKDPSNGILLYGPPGNGKTMLAKATATALSDTHKGFQKSGYIYVKGPEILNKYVGNSEQKVRSLFERAREHEEENGYPAVIFIDEADAILGKRGERNVGGLNDTIVPMFLSEMDGLDETNAIVLLATNRADKLDPAVTRDGRIDRKLYVPRPDQKAAEEIARIHLEGAATDSDLSVDSLAELLTEQLYSDDRILHELDTQDEDFCLREVVSGAMIAGSVEKAVTQALHRDMEEGRSNPSGIQEEDIVSAVDKVHQENKNLNHQDELEEFMGVDSSSQAGRMMDLGTAGS